MHLCISIHALVKRATFCQNMAIQHAIDFNPRPREEGDIRLMSAERNSFYFNPRPREEGDVTTMFTSMEQDISIHALVKRATANLYNDYLYFEAKYHISDIFPL